MLEKVFGILLSLFCLNVFAAEIAIIDTPVDFLHENLYKVLSPNQKEWSPSSGLFDSQKIFDNRCPANGDEYYCRFNYALELSFRLERDLDKNGLYGDLFGFDFVKGDNFTPELPNYVILKEDQLKVLNCSYLYAQYELKTISNSDFKILQECFSNEQMKTLINKFSGHSHGSHVAGIISSVTANNKIYGATFLRGYDSGDNGDIEKILKYISNRKTPIANCSYGGTGDYSEQLMAQEKTLYESAGKVLFAIAAGNDSFNLNKKEKTVVPAMINAKNSITVAALKPNGELAEFSNYGDQYVDVAAPGVAIKSSGLENRMVYMSGTSQATPYVAGIAGMIYDACPTKFTPELAKKILIDTSDKKVWLVGKTKSAGIVNAQNAVAAMKKLCELKSNFISKATIDSVTLKYRTSIDYALPPEDNKEELDTSAFNSDNITFTEIK